MKHALFFLLAGCAFAAIVTYTYDAAGRLTGVDYGNGATILYTYDSNGNLLSRTATAAASQFAKKDKIDDTKQDRKASITGGRSEPDRVRRAPHRARQPHR